MADLPRIAEKRKTDHCRRKTECKIIPAVWLRKKISPGKEVKREGETDYTIRALPNLTQPMPRQNTKSKG